MARGHVGIGHSTRTEPAGPAAFAHVDPPGGAVMSLTARPPLHEPDCPAATTRRWTVPLLAVGVTAALVVVGVMATVGGPSGGTGAMSMTRDPRFAVLRVATSNRCSLQADELGGMAPDGRLRGSCCSPMEQAAYLRQRQGLSRYRAEAVVPADPYDIPVPLAQRLVGYRKISLDAGQQADFDQAKDMSKLGGPCCCRCWRWDAFEGQAKFLITERGYAPAAIASIWDLEDGCGGSATA